MLVALLSAAWAGTGFIEGIAFDPDGRPQAGVELRLGETRIVTGPDGSFRAEVEAGEHPLRVGGETLSPVAVAEGLSTELILTLVPGATQVLVESPVAAAAVNAVPTGPPGTITGRVLDPASGQPLAGARVFVRGSEQSATTGADGRYTLNLPSGRWDLSFIRAGHATANLEAEVPPSDSRTLDVPLEKSGVLLDDLTVTAPRIVGGTATALEERQESSTVSDILGAEQMSKSGDSDAASALKRVTGLTVIGGKYVYVRGLGDRYSATLLNGSSLPSPEPEKRVVPLDIFPTSLVEQVVIQKTFSPDRPAEFGGGVVEVQTRNIPEKPVLNLGVSGSYVAGTSFEEGLSGPVGPTDWLGLGTAYRALPAGIAEASAEEPLKSQGMFTEGGYTAEELEAFGELIPARWGLSTREVPPDFGLTLNAGGRVPAGDFSLGALFGGVYNNGWDIEKGVRSNFASSSDGLVESKRTTFENTENTVRVGAALALGIEYDERFSLRSTTLLNRSSTASALSWLADDPAGASDTLSERSSWVEQQLLFEQVAASLDFEVVKLEGRVATSVATREEPDRREWTYNLAEDGSYVLSQRGSWNDIQYLALEDTLLDGGLDVTVPFTLFAEEATVKVGGQRATRARESGTRRFAFALKGTDGIDLAAPIEDVMVAENIGKESDDDTGYMQLEENTINSDDYSAGQEIYAAYALGEAGYGPRLRVLGGARFERSVQTVTTFEQFDTSKEPVVAELGSSDWLPAATVTYAVGGAGREDDMLVRVGYGRTLSRPEFRELTEVQYYDYRSGRTLYGNPDLHRAVIENIDARWEWYPREGESVSAGVFFKYFDHPIESVVAVSAVSGSVGTFANATSATNLGAELDARQRLDIAADWLRDVYLSGNVSFIHSQVDLSDTEGNQTSESRPLQGQSPWVVNAQVSYENPDIKTAVALSYNAFGPRIVDVGTSGIPDTYEMPVHRVDVAYTQGIGKRLSLRLRGSNLLDWPSVQKVGEEVSEETRSGWSAGLSLTVGL